MTTWTIPNWYLLAGLLTICRFCILAVAITEPIPAAVAPPTAQAFLDPHNAARAQVHVPPLRWNATLAAYAQAYGRRQRDANQCAMLVHSWNSSSVVGVGQLRYGENLFWGSHSETTSAEWAVQYWASEREVYDYEANRCEPAFVECGHYTQVVWRDSKELGCAAVPCQDASVLVVCEYFPPGNVAGKRPF